MDILLKCLPVDKIWDWASDKVTKFVNLDDDLRSLESKVATLSDRKSDVDSEVKTEKRSGTKKMKKKKEVKRWFEKAEKTEGEFRELKTSIEQGCFLKNAFSGGDRVEKMVGIVDQLMEDSKHFDGLVLEDFGSRSEPRVTTKLFGEMFHRGLTIIQAWLGTSNISSIGIYGLGGVGKTTLVEHIHNRLLEERQWNVYWITFTQESSIKNLQDDIAQCLSLDLPDGDYKIRAERLRKEFKKKEKEKPIVLILDDVCKEFEFEKVGIPLECKVILTTRSLDVCNGMQCQENFNLKTLDENEAWDLFKHVLGRETLLSLNEESKRVAKSIAQRCAGLPLGIKAMAGSMRGVHEVCDWRIALRQLEACSRGLEKMEQDVFPILELSFNRLDECQRKCFLYCSLYPKDSKITRKELINIFRWAELMPKWNSTSDEIDQGHAILNKLIKVSLLEKARDFKGNKCVKMHDLLRDMALRITNGKSVLEMKGDVPRFLVKSLRRRDSEVALKHEEWTEDLRAVSYSENLYAIEIRPALSPNCSNLSILLLRSPHIRKIPDSFFKPISGVKVLDLSYCESLEELPDCVSDIESLTALVLRGCGKLKSLPPLGKLTQLRELDLSLTGGIKYDPEVLNQLEIFTGCLSLKDFRKISKLPEYYKVCITDNFLRRNLFSLYQLNLIEDSNDEFGESKQLHFHRCNLGEGSNYPWLPNDLKRLMLEECVTSSIRCLSDVFGDFTSSDHLLSLEVYHLSEIGYLFKLSSASPCGPPRNLQYLRLVNLSKLVGLLYWESEAHLLRAGTFSSLTKLSVSSCGNIKKLLTVQLLQNLQNLVHLHVHDCFILEIAANDNGVGQ